MSTGRTLHLLLPELALRTQRMREQGVLHDADVWVVDSVAGRFGETDPDVLMGLAFAVRAPRAGHIGVDLRNVHAVVDNEHELFRSADEGEPSPEPLDWPEDVLAWETQVAKSALVGGPGTPNRPFVHQVLNDGRALIMTRRMWREQERLAQALLVLAEASPTLALDDDLLSQGMVGLFDGAESQGALAVSTAAKGCLTLVTGGPGTGKTYSIKRLLALLLGAHPSLRIELAAPTGKAAVRMAEAIAEDLESLELEAAVHDGLVGLAPKTLHKLLGMRPDGSSRHGKDNVIPADLVVVDEASMVDLALMRRLLESMAPGARLVLLGDRDQLASVEAGTVLADVVGPVLDESADGDALLARTIVSFSVNYRFQEAPTVAAIAEGLTRGGDEDRSQVLSLMRGETIAPGDPMPDRITHLGQAKDGRPSDAQLDELAAPYLREDGFIGLLSQAILDHGATSRELEEPLFHQRLLDALEHYRILAVHRRGPLGVGGLESQIVRRAKAVLVSAVEARRSGQKGKPAVVPSRHGQWLGRPILITRNSYEVGLMNGDIGLVLPVGGKLAAVFPVKTQGASSSRSVALSRLPEHRGAFAMTVHKSQGSQFDRVALVLAGRPSPIQTRELIYTGITRTCGRLDWLGDADELRDALERRIQRASGLPDLLWNP
jgi:exodeoxyribonuclease V alpha subunit